MYTVLPVLQSCMQRHCLVDKAAEKNVPMLKSMGGRSIENFNIYCLPPPPPGGTVTLTKKNRKYEAPKKNFLLVILELLEF